jgi:membrane fusion protein (multidrug efflux system)
MVSTDDAYVGADTATLSPKIAGYVKLVPVADNAFVTAGTPLVILDDADYQVALRQANAQVATQEATIDRIGEQMKAAAAQIDSATAQLSSATAAAANAKADYDRVSALLGKGFSTQKDADASRTALTQANAAADAANAALSAAKANAGVVAAQKTEAERVLAQYRLASEQAQLNLDHTIIRAPFDGTVGNRAAEPGEFVAAGTRLLALVPANVYVDANFKETQLDRLTAGQSVTVTVDAYPDHPFMGVVESVAPASGSSFSLLPPDNATGNFTKIVQRVPVRIRLSDSTANSLVRPGMSVVADVDTRHAEIGVASR